jgi:multiple sugar transport system substrate-binding protein
MHSLENDQKTDDRRDDVQTRPMATRVPGLSRRRLLASFGALPATKILGRSGSARAAQAEGGTITWLGHPVFDELTKAQRAEYQELTGVEIKFEGIPYPGLRDKIYLELASNSATYDLVTMGSQWWTFDVAPKLAVLDSLITSSPPEDLEDVNSGLLSLFRVNEQQVGWPLRSGVFILHYRQDLYDELGLQAPQTFEDYKANAIKLNRPPERYGAVVMGTPDGFAADDWINFLYSFGGQILSDDLKEVVLDSAPGYAAAEYWASLIREELVPPGTPSRGYAELIAALQQGLAAQAIAFSPYAVNISNPEESRFAGKFGWAVVPVARDSGLEHSRTFLQCWGLFIPQASRNKELAWDFVAWLTNSKNDLAMALKGNGPVRNSTFDLPEYRQINPAGAVTVEAMNYGHIGIPPVPERPQIQNVLTTKFNTLAAGAKSPREAVDESARLIRELLS